MVRHSTASLLLAAALAAGCAGRQAAEAPKAAKEAPREQKQAGLADYIEKPEVLVARIGERWGLRLGEIESPEHRAQVARDLARIEEARKERRLPPPGRSYLWAVRPGLYAVLVLPALFRVAEADRVDLYLWDYTGQREAARSTLAVRPVAELRPGGPPTHAGARRDEAYTLRAPREGPFQVHLTLARADQVLLDTSVATAARPGKPPEKPGP